MKKILICSKREDDKQTLTRALGDGYGIDTVTGRNEALECLRRTYYDLVFIDLDMLPAAHKLEYQDAIEPFIEKRVRVEIIIITPMERIRHAVRFVKAGASDYIISPVHAEEVKHVVESISEDLLKEHELDYLRDQFWKPEVLDLVETKNSKMAVVFNKVRAVAPTKSTVLLTGETGTGKSLIARLIHLHSNRSNNAFISVHCGAIPDTLVESELFGHEKGAFTGAVRRKIGKFEMAKGGTIFLDEIGTITPAVQIKMLQVLQDGTFSRVGGEASLQTDGRIITATNSDLIQMADDGRFRKDLLYRLNVFPIDIPSLRERLEDLPYLINVLLRKLNLEFNKGVQHVHPLSLSALKGYHWPGNIRELENILERAFILETTSVLCPESFPVDLFGDDMPLAPVPIDSAETLANARLKAVDEFERQYIKELLKRNKGKINKSAEEAGVSTRQLYKLMTKHAIRKEDFRS